MAAESGASIHTEAVQRKSRVYRPGLTKAQTSSRASPLAMHIRHRRQRPRHDGATLMRYVQSRASNVAAQPVTLALAHPAAAGITLEQRMVHSPLEVEP